MEPEAHLLKWAIEHVNRAAELAREGDYEGANTFSLVGDSYRQIAHELRVGRSKRKFSDIAEDAQLPYPMKPRVIDEGYFWNREPQYGTFVQNFPGSETSTGDGPIGTAMNDAEAGDRLDIAVSDSEETATDDVL